MKAKWMVGLLTLVLLATLTSAVLAQDNTTNPAAGNAAAAGQRHGQGVPQAVLDKLTDEQKAQLQAKIKELRDKNTKPAEIKTAVQEMLKGWGIEMPQGGPQRGGGAFGKAPWMDKLTADQKQQLLAKVKELRDKNATREETRAAVQEMLKGWGIDPGPARGQAAGKLTDEQKTQLQAKIKELCEKDATREEILTAVRETLGLQAAGAGPGKAPWMGKLTEEQKTQLQAKIKELREKGATREEIRTAVQEMLKGWGIDPGQAGAGGGQGQHRQRGGQGAPGK